MPTLHRFLNAQQATYETALAEIRSGRKRSHWMWFIFPQIQGLGISETARFYAIRDAREAAAYLTHPVLGPRLETICQALLDLPSDDATRILGRPDDVKLCSCLTLFAAVPGADAVFQAGLDKFFGGRPDPATLARLAPLA